MSTAHTPDWMRWVDSGTAEYGGGTATDSSGNVYIAGYSDGTGTSIRFGNTAAYAKPATTLNAAFFGKLDSSGVPQWLQWIDGGSSDYGASVATDLSGSVYVMGRSQSGGTTIRFGDDAAYPKPSTTGTATFFGKFDGSGVGQWLKWIDGTGDELPGTLLTDSVGNVYVYGYSSTTGTSILFGASGDTYTKPATSQNAVFLGKLDSSGVRQWLQWIDGPLIDLGVGLALDSSGNIYVGGNSSSTATSMRFGTIASYAKPATVGSAVFVGKLDSSGTPQWVQWIDGAGAESGGSVSVDSAGNVYVGGFSDTSGTVIRFGDNASYTKPATTLNAAFVGKLDSSGVGQWLQWIDGTGADSINSVVADSAGNIYFTGNSTSTETAILFADNAAYAKPSTIGIGVFVGKLNTLGTGQWILWIDGGATTVEYGNMVILDSSGNLYINGTSGTTATTIRFGNIAAFSKPGTASNAVFLAKLLAPLAAATAYTSQILNAVISPVRRGDAKPVSGQTMFFGFGGGVMRE